MGRLPYVEKDELAPAYRDLVVSSLQPGKTINIYSAVANNPAVLEGLRTFLGSLWGESGLTDRQREIVILSAASEIGSAYEWHQHESIASVAGLSPAEIAAIGRDDRRQLPEEDATLVAYTRAVVRGRVTDELHEEVADQLGTEETVGAAATAAGYLALGRLIQAFDVDLESGDTFVGWDPRAD